MRHYKPKHCTIQNLARIDIAFGSNSTATSKMSFENYLPNELLLEILSHFDSWNIREKQSALARFSAVNR